jgi:hypothetical protein
MEARVQTPLDALDKNPFERVTSCDVQKLTPLLKLKKSLEIMLFPTKASVLLLNRNSVSRYFFRKWLNIGQ